MPFISTEGIAFKVKIINQLLNQLSKYILIKTINQLINQLVYRSMLHCKNLDLIFLQFALKYVLSKVVLKTFDHRQKSNLKECFREKF